MEEFSVIELLNILRAHIKLIVSFIIGWTVVIAAVTFFIVTPQYSSSSQILVNNTSAGENIQGNTIETDLRLISTYKDIIKSPVILDEVRTELGTGLSHDQLSSKITMSNQDSSQVFSLKVTDESPQEAALIANTVAETFQNKVGEMMNVDNVTIISSAVPEPAPISPNKPLSIAVGLLMGLGTGVGAVFILQFADNTVKDDKFITEKLQWTSLGQIEEVSVKEITVLNGEDSPEELTASTQLKSRV